MTNQPIVARGEATEAELAAVHRRLEWELGKAGAYLDGIYVCPHHPDRGFPGERADLKIACDCRKPATGLVERARRDLGIDLSPSWMIGDQTRDVEIGGPGWPTFDPGANRCGRPRRQVPMRGGPCRARSAAGRRVHPVRARGAARVIISRTPLRVSFLGGGSDLPAYYRRHGGAVLSTAIDQSVYVTVSRKFDDAVRVSYSHTEEVAHARDVVHPLVREALAMLGIDGGIEITSIADIPAKRHRSRLVELLHRRAAQCAARLSGPPRAGGRSWPAECCTIEIERCGEPIGKQDQYAAAFGGFNFIRFHGDERVEVNKVVCAPGVIAGIQERLLFFYTGITRSASESAGRQSQEMAADACKQKGMADMVRLAEAAYAELCAGKATSLGEMLDDAWQIKKRMTDGISNTLVDDAYAAAIGAGAEGGKLLGAGGGGFLMFYAEPERHDAIRRALGGLARNAVPLRRAWLQHHLRALMTGGKPSSTESCPAARPRRPPLLARPLALPRTLPGSGLARPRDPLQADRHRRRLGGDPAASDDGYFHGRFRPAGQAADRRRGALCADGLCRHAAVVSFSSILGDASNSIVSNCQPDRQSLFPAHHRSECGSGSGAGRFSHQPRAHGHAHGLVPLRAELAHCLSSRHLPSWPCWRRWGPASSSPR